MGSFSGDASVGSVLGRMNVPNPAGNLGVSGIYNPSEDGAGNIAYQKNAPTGNGVIIPDGYIVFNVNFSGGLLTSSEGLLNVTKLNAQNLTGAGPFTFGGNSIVTIQRAQSSFTDALVTPEPSTGLLAAGALAAAWAMKRRKQ